jgi:beta-glucanase (GH16 family)
MASAIGDTQVLLRDDFNTNGKINSSVWDFNHWNADPKKDGSYYGRTQQRQELPSAQDGFLHLKLDTYNPSSGGNPTFFGSEAISLKTFEMGSGVAIEFSGRFTTDQRGLVAGLFTYSGTASSHDEIDFEGLTNHPTSVQSNIYAAEPLGAGRPEQHDIGAPLTDMHIYRVEWLPDAVRWLVDGKEVRVEHSRLPTHPMAVHLNIWAPDAGWGNAFDPSLVATNVASQNKSFEFLVDYVQVSRLSVVQGSDSHDTLHGTAASDAIYGGHGDDVLIGGHGDDRLVGGNGNDVAHYDLHSSQAVVTRNADRSVTVTSSHGTDTLHEMEFIRFADQTTLATVPQGVGTDLFDQAFYLAANPDVASFIAQWPAITALDHFTMWGAREGRDPNALFDEDWYLAQHPDVAAAVAAGIAQSGYQHYQMFGAQEDRDPSRWFDASAYGEAHAGVSASGMPPLAHYLTTGAQSGLPFVGVPVESGA